MVSIHGQQLESWHRRGDQCKLSDCPPKVAILGREFSNTLNGLLRDGILCLLLFSFTCTPTWGALLLHFLSYMFAEEILELSKENGFVTLLGDYLDRRGIQRYH